MPLTVHSPTTGVPHAVVFTDDLASVELKRFGAAMRYQRPFRPEGHQRELRPGSRARSHRDPHLRTRVEDETLACGTGMVACALIHPRAHRAPSPVRVRVAGGDTLEIGFTETGPGQYAT